MGNLVSAVSSCGRFPVDVASAAYSRLAGATDGQQRKQPGHLAMRSYHLDDDDEEGDADECGDDYDYELDPSLDVPPPLPSSSSSSSSRARLPRSAVLRRTCVDAVTHAAVCCQRIQAQLCTADVAHKEDRSPVTVADYACQALLAHVLTQAFPDIPLIAEESSTDLQRTEGLTDRVLSSLADVGTEMTKEQLWQLIGAHQHDDGEQQKPKLWFTLDPIDGTLGYLKRGQWAIALALMRNDEPYMGFLACPALPYSMRQPDVNRGCLFIAERNRGTYVRSLNGQSSEEEPVRVTPHVDVPYSVVTESPNAGHSHAVIGSIKGHMGTQTTPIRLDSQAKYALVARGDASLYLRYSGAEYRECIWDHAAGALVVAEAGGVVVDFAGRALDFSQGRRLRANAGIVCTTRGLLPHVMAAIDACASELKEDPLLAPHEPQDNDYSEEPL